MLEDKFAARIAYIRAQAIERLLAEGTLNSDDSVTIPAAALLNFTSVASSFSGRTYEEQQEARRNVGEVLFSNVNTWDSRFGV